MVSLVFSKQSFKKINKFYSKLYDSEAKWWYLPVEELYIELEKTKSMENDLDNLLGLDNELGK